MRGRKKAVTIENIKEEFEAKGAELLTTEYLGCSQKLQFLCSVCKEPSEIMYRSYKSGRNSKLLCRSCMKSVSIEQIRETVNASGSELISTQFDTVDVPLEIKCRECGNIFTITWANYKVGHNKEFLCRSCRNRYKSNIIVSNDKIHVVLITTEKASKQLYKEKLQYAEKGILFVPVYKNELGNPVLNAMLDFRSDNVALKIPARKCTCDLVPKEVAKQFLNFSHIQGWHSAEVICGLYYNGILYSVMSFGRSRFNSKYEYELIRLATLPGVELVGGASKMFKWFVENYQPESVISYCDLRFSWTDPQMTVYPKMGFSFVRKSEANYRYWTKDLKKSYSRMACQKHRLPNFLDTFDPTLSEYENMKQNGFIRLFDCGNLVFEWKNPCI